MASPEAGRSRRRVAIGPKRPQYLASRESDRLPMVVTALVAEGSALRDRMATHEALAGMGIAATEDAVEAYRPDTGRDAGRKAERTALFRRVDRVITENAMPSIRSRTTEPLDGDAGRMGQ